MKPSDSDKKRPNPNPQKPEAKSARAGDFLEGEAPAGAGGGGSGAVRAAPDFDVPDLPELTFGDNLWEDFNEGELETTDTATASGALAKNVIGGVSSLPATDLEMGGGGSGAAANAHFASHSPDLNSEGEAPTGAGGGGSGAVAPKTARGEYKDIRSTPNIIKNKPNPSKFKIFNAIFGAEVVVWLPIEKIENPTKKKIPHPPKKGDTSVQLFIKKDPKYKLVFKKLMDIKIDGPESRTIKNQFLYNVDFIDKYITIYDHLDEFIDHDSEGVEFKYTSFSGTSNQMTKTLGLFSTINGFAKPSAKNPPKGLIRPSDDDIAGFFKVERDLLNAKLADCAGNEASIHKVKVDFLKKIMHSTQLINNHIRNALVDQDYLKKKGLFAYYDKYYVQYSITSLPKLPPISPLLGAALEPAIEGLDGGETEAPNRRRRGRAKETPAFNPEELPLGSALGTKVLSGGETEAPKPRRRRGRAIKDPKESHVGLKGLGEGNTESFSFGLFDLVSSGGVVGSDFTQAPTGGEVEGEFDKGFDDKDDASWKKFTQEVKGLTKEKAKGPTPNPTAEGGGSGAAAVANSPLDEGLFNSDLDEDAGLGNWLLGSEDEDRLGEKDGEAPKPTAPATTFRPAGGPKQSVGVPKKSSRTT